MSFRRPFRSNDEGLDGVEDTEEQKMSEGDALLRKDEEYGIDVTDDEQNDSDTTDLLLKPPKDSTTTSQLEVEKVEPKLTWNQIFTVLLLMVAFAFARTAVFVQLLATSLAAKTFTEGKAPSELNTIPLAFLYYGGTIVAPMASKFMEAVGRQVGFIVGCVLGIVGGGVCILATWLHSEDYVPFWVNFVLLTTGSLFLGFANGFVNFFRFAAADAAPQRRSLAISVVLFGGDVAALIGPTLSDWSKDLIWDYGMTYISLVVLFGCTIITLFFVRIPKIAKAELANAAPPRPIWKLLQIPRLLLALITATVGFGMMVLLMVLIPLVMDKDFALGDISHVLQVHSVGMFAPGLVVGFLIERFGTIAIDFVGIWFLIGANVIMILGVDYWNYMVGMFLLGVGWNLTFISSTTLLTQTYLPSEKATTQGLNDFIMYFIVSSLSLASGSLWTGLGSWANVNYLSLGVSAFGGVVIIVIVIYEWTTVPRTSPPKTIN